ncbi:MAG: class III extradiol dioxygenase subunit B-like domain-containing protein [Patescibacteria group bacterium]|nr:class III extradiol dioxygenase subunit B-like domain-containing protein [Patescibacteria group bacterium]
MPIVFAAIAPHSPPLLKRVGGGHSREHQVTLESYLQLERTLYASKCDTVVLLSPHGEGVPGTFGVGVADRCVANLEPLGDFSSNVSWRGDVATAQALRSVDESRQSTLPIRLNDQQRVDYGVAIPVMLLSSHQPNLAILPIHTTSLPAAQHWRFGQFLGNELRARPQRYAVVASGDLSNRLTATSENAAAAQGAAFDRQMLEMIRRGDAASIVNFDAELIQAVGSCGYLPIVTLLGVLDRMRYHSDVISYEAPHGVGMLCVGFDFR